MPQQNNSNDLKEKLEEVREKEAEESAKKTAKKTSFPYLDLSARPIDQEALATVPEELARAAGLAVFQKENEKDLKVAVFDPLSPAVQKIIEDLKKKGFVPSLFIVSQKSLAKAFLSYRNIVSTGRKEDKTQIDKSSLEKLAKELKTVQSVKTEIEKLKEANVSQILEIILAGALQNEASDVHLENEEQRTLLRFRLDGMLQEIASLDEKTAHLVLSRLKLISGVALNIKDKPQDGRFSIEIDGSKLEVRSSFIPSPQGENTVLRLLNPKSINLTLKDLGLREDIFEIIKKEIKQPNGLIITTGPTGSGKTTTLYAFLKEITRPELKIITLEDPIEYHLTGITQTQVEIERGYTFAEGLRAALRQDPDILMVGEIRDKETAEIALQSALTGHLVFSTLHTNDAAGAVPRFLDLGASAKTVASALSLAIAQRLVRRLCPDCKEEVEPTKEEKEKIDAALKNLPESIKKTTLSKIYKPKGCDRCNGIGFKGRIGIYEIIEKEAELEKFISTSPGHAEILEFLNKKGFVSMFQDGVLKVLEGITSLEEVKNMTGKQD